MSRRVAWMLLGAILFVGRAEALGIGILHRHKGLPKPSSLINDPKRDESYKVGKQSIPEASHGRGRHHDPYWGRLDIALKNTTPHFNHSLFEE
jgi:hypothetical protein